MTRLLEWVAVVAACFSALLLVLSALSVPVTLWAVYWGEPVTHNQKIGLVVGLWCWLSLAFTWCWYRMMERQS